VTEPDIHSAEQAREWLGLLRVTLRQLGVSDVNMEEGSLRCDANVSVRPAGSEELGTKTELKNMNSFRFLQRGIEAELERQRGLVESGGQVVQETLHFDPRDGSLTPLRSKEEAHDYRYFPEPDLVPLAPTEAMLQEAREALPELPAARIGRYESELGLAPDVALTLATDPETAGYFEQTLAAADGAEPKVVANWVTGELAAALRQAEVEGGAGGSKVTPDSLAALIALVQEKKISHGSGKTVLATLVAEGGDPAAIVEREGLAQMSDSGELEAIVEKAMAENADAVERVRGGNEKAIGAIVGAVMRETKGRADGGEVNRLIEERL
ncbi:MAG TPA: Asp-tRNA(Asn)/Glu-tRNA(Gln) amidotransferase subunit GatB, partial [Solirubrobacterales bacterium]